MDRCKYDTHVHTSEVSSCGCVPAKEVVQIYKDAGYQGIIITDHYYDNYFASLDDLDWDKKIDCYLKGYHIASDVGKQLGLQVLLGMEIRFTENANDYLVYGIDETFLREYKELYRLSLKEFKDLIGSKDILIFQAHPFRARMISAPPELLDGVEVYNGNPRHDSSNEKAYEYALNHNLLMISGTDFHQRDDILTGGGIIVSEKIRTSQEMVDLIPNLNINNLIF